MVRVWYEPPPGMNPRANLNMGPHGPSSAMEPMWVKKLARMRPVTVIVPAVGMFLFVCYLPLMNPKNLPQTLSPEHQAAQRAYMRYHNMNPIHGISSKQARASDPDP